MQENKYKQSVISMLENLESIQQAKNEIMKEFNNLTMHFERNVVDIASQPPPDDG
jgi:hypothetical protein